MPEGWRDSCIGQEFTLQRGFDITRKDQRAGRVPVVSSGGVSSYHDTAMADGPGVVIGRKGTLGTVYWLDSSYWPHDTTLWVRDFKDSNPRFVYYFLRALDVSHLDVGSANPTLNRNHVHALPVSWPPPVEQDSIARLLSAIDEMIESNGRVLAGLEEAAGRLFAAHFIGFVGTQDFEDTAIGELPIGWEAGSLTDLARFVNGKAFTKSANGAGLPILRIRELKSGVDASTPSTDLIAAEENVARFGDILFAWSGSLDVYRWGGDDGLINQHIFKVIPRGYPSWFVYGWIQQHMRSFQSAARDRAVTMGHIRRHHLAEAAVPIPTEQALLLAGRVLDPIEAQALALTAETNTLTKIRDVLLPRLVSGQLRITEETDQIELVAGVPR